MPLTTEDRALIERLRDGGRVVLPADQRVTDVTYYRQQNFTIALVTIRTKDRKSALVTVGVAKRNCNDDGEAPRRGADIALTRALRGDAKPIIDPTVSLAT
jgi:hypothetical protein